MEDEFVEWLTKTHKPSIVETVLAYVNAPDLAPPQKELPPDNSNVRYERNEPDWRETAWPWPKDQKRKGIPEPTPEPGLVCA